MPTHYYCVNTIYAERIDSGWERQGVSEPDIWSSGDAVNDTHLNTHVRPTVLFCGAVYTGFRRIYIKAVSAFVSTLDRVITHRLRPSLTGSDDTTPGTPSKKESS